MATRPDNPIDLWKGVTILSVLNIHTCFWAGVHYLPDWARQASLLLDIPVFFFISGYLFYSPDPGKLLRRGLSQVVRLIVDYWVVSVAALVLLVALRTLYGAEPPLPDPLLTISTTLALHPRGPIWDQFIGFPWSMWYLHVYLSLLGCGLVVLAAARGNGLILALVAATALILSVFIDPSVRFLLFHLKHVCFYLSLFLCGAAFKGTPTPLQGRCLWWAWVALIAATVAVIVGHQGLPSIQTEKFPPSLTYFVVSSYSVLIFCSLALRPASLPTGAASHRFVSFVCWCGANTYRIYLWQGITASVPFLFVLVMIANGFSVIATYLAALAWVAFSTLSLVCLHNGIEKLVIQAINVRFARGPSSRSVESTLRDAVEAEGTPSLAGE